MIKRYAIVENEVVSNVIYIDDGDSRLIQELGVIEIPDTLVVGIGSDYKNGIFTELLDPVEETVDVLQELSFEEIEMIIQGIIDENSAK